MIAYVVYTLSFVFSNPKTSYDMRISYWTSDVCSSDLLVNRAAYPQFRAWRAVPKGPLTGRRRRLPRQGAPQSVQGSRGPRSRAPREDQHLSPQKAKHPIMKLTIERAALIKSLTHVQSVVERQIGRAHV